MKCGDCKFFWLSRLHQDEGDCRRRAPVAVPSAVMEIIDPLAAIAHHFDNDYVMSEDMRDFRIACWPSVGITEWCGEWQPKQIGTNYE